MIGTEPDRQSAGQSAGQPSWQPVEIRQPRGARLCIQGRCVARACAHDHDGRVRRRFVLYTTANGYACERIDDPGLLDERCFGAVAEDARAVYEFFGTEPLANYLYGLARLAVPGLTGRAASGRD